MGTWTVIERPETRNYGLAMPGEQHTLDLAYQVRWTPANSSDPYPGDQQMLGASGLPKIRDRLPSGIYGSDTFLKTFVCRSVEATMQREAAYVWEVICRFGSFDTYTVDQGKYVQITRSSGVRAAQMWRISPTFPANGTVAWPGSVVDIGGTKVDLNGNPPTYEVPQMSMTFELLWDRTREATPEPPTSSYSSYIGNRNDAVFLGCDIGTVVYQGFTISPSYEWYRIQHQFLFDAWYHLEQVPIPKPTGQPLCTSGATVAGVVVLQADKIGFFQKYPSTATFATLMGSGNMAEITSPKPTYP